MYIPVNANDMYPGCIRVFNDDGHWIKATWDITSKNHGFVPIDKEALEVTVRPLKWEIVPSEKISNLKVEIKSKMAFLYLPYILY